MQIPHLSVLLGGAGEEAGRWGFSPNDSRPAYRRQNRTESDLTGCAVRKGREHITSGTSSFFSACSSSAMAISFPVLTAGGWKPRCHAHERIRIRVRRLRSEGNRRGEWKVETAALGKGGKGYEKVRRSRAGWPSNGCDAPLFVVRRFRSFS
jgi:hypothetical protein